MTGASDHCSNNVGGQARFNLDPVACDGYDVVPALPVDLEDVLHVFLVLSRILSRPFLKGREAQQTLLITAYTFDRVSREYFNQLA